MADQQRATSRQEEIARGIEEALFQLRDKGPEFPYYKPCQLNCSKEDAEVIIKALRSETASREWEGYPGIAHDLEAMRAALKDAVAAKEAELEGFRRNLGRDPLVKVEWLEAARAALKNAAPQPPTTPRPSTPGPNESSDSANAENVKRQPCERDSGGTAAASAPVTETASGIPDEFKQLAEFYDVQDMASLVRVQEERIESMRQQLPKLRGPESDPQNYRRG